MLNTLDSRTVATLDELRETLDHFAEMAKEAGHHGSTVYVPTGLVMLVEKTLTDGSCVLDIRFGPEAA